MKTVVLLNELTHSDVIKNELYEDYINYLKNDIERLLLNGEKLLDVDCPGCGQQNSKKAYEKWGLSYKKCLDCESVYVSPRPSKKALDKFYEQSEACRFWRKEVLQMDESQLYYIYGPKVNWVSNLVDAFVKNPTAIIDYETKYPFLLAAILKTNIFKHVGIIQPQAYELMNLIPSEVVTDSQVEQYRAKTSVITAFETLERMFDPNQFF